MKWIRAENVGHTVCLQTEYGLPTHRYITSIFFVLHHSFEQCMFRWCSPKRPQHAAHLEGCIGERDRFVFEVRYLLYLLPPYLAQGSFLIHHLFPLHNLPFPSCYRTVSFWQNSSLFPKAKTTDSGRETFSCGENNIPHFSLKVCFSFPSFLHSASRLPNGSCSMTEFLKPYLWRVV